MNMTINNIFREFPDSKIAEGTFDPIRHISQFLQALYGDWKKKYPNQYFEVRLLGNNRAEACFYQDYVDFVTHDLPELLNIQKSEGINIYFGVAPRVAKQGTNKNVKTLPCLWADLDGNAAKDIFMFKPVPDIIVFSGNGYHAYWTLNTPAPAGETTQKALRSIQKACKSDYVSDFARILRLPGSFNLKEPKIPKLCKVCYISKELCHAL
jgi:hypothetical protein